MSRPPRSGQVRPRVLVLEDEFFIARDIGRVLVSAGCRIVGPVACLKAGREALDAEPLDGAVLDINLRGEPAFEFAEELLARRVPVVFTTGYDAGKIPASLFRRCLVVQKPFRDAELAAAARTAFGCP